MPGRQESRSGVSRRAFIQIGAVLTTGSAAAGCVTTDDGRPLHHDISAPDRPPAPPSQTPTQGVYQFFDAGQARTVDAIVSRLIPADAAGPGAREAGATTYIDAALASFEAFAEPTYAAGPFAEGYTGDTPPGPDTDEVVYVPQAELFRYGPQGSMTPQELYRDGLAGLDRYCRQRHDAVFVDLEDAAQDAVLDVLDAVSQRNQNPPEQQEGGSQPEDGEQSGPPDTEINAAKSAFGEVDPGSFFSTIWQDTVYGMFADPVYGGNRGLVGWTMIGYPGPQRSYTVQEMKTGTAKRPQSLDGLHAMNPDVPGQHAPDALEQPRDGVGQG